MVAGSSAAGIAGHPKGSVPGPATEALGKVARQTGTYLVVGVIERDTAYGGGTLYCTMLYFGPEGDLLGKHRKLKPGMAFTIEPGLYFPAEYDFVPKHFRGIGIRIEDDVVITKSGHKNLTDSCPKEIAEIEAL